MYRGLAITALIMAAGDLQAADCDALGIKDTGSAESLCAELERLGAASKTGRGLGTDATDENTGPALQEWPQIDLIQDAYRADPRKTLELIRRIKDAGGLASD